MPLPPPPAKRGARLSTDVIELAARRPSSASPSPSPSPSPSRPAACQPGGFFTSHARACMHAAEAFTPLRR